MLGNRKNPLWGMKLVKIQVFEENDFDVTMKWTDCFFFN
jgi:hypothetical protein